MNSAVVVKANEQADPSLVVFGRDGAGKPRASWFDAPSAELATKAADLMQMRVLKVETEEQKAVARQLAPGGCLRAVARSRRSPGLPCSASSLSSLTALRKPLRGRRRRRRVLETAPRRLLTALAQHRAVVVRRTRHSDLRTGRKSASVVWCWPTKVRKTAGGKASSSASTGSRSR